MTKQFLALARVSSREHEREGFSLDGQEQACCVSLSSMVAP